MQIAKIENFAKLKYQRAELKTLSRFFKKQRNSLRIFRKSEQLEQDYLEFLQIFANYQTNFNLARIRSQAGGADSSFYQEELAYYLANEAQVLLWQDQLEQDFLNSSLKTNPKYSLRQARSKNLDLDPKILAQILEEKYLYQKGTASLESKFFALYRLRQSLAKQAGEKNYLDLKLNCTEAGFLKADRRRKFRTMVLKYFLPIFKTFCKNYLEALGQDLLTSADFQEIGRSTYTKEDVLDLLESAKSSLAEDSLYLAKLIKKSYARLSSEHNFTGLSLWSYNLPYLLLPQDQPYLLGLALGEAVADLASLNNHAEQALSLAPSLIRNISATAYSFLLHPSLDEQKSEALQRDLVLGLFNLLRCSAIDSLEAYIYQQEDLEQKDLNERWALIEAKYLLMQGEAIWLESPEIFQSPFLAIQKAMAFVLVLAERPLQKNRNSLKSKLNQLLCAKNQGEVELALKQSGFASLDAEDSFKKAAFSLAYYLGL